MTGLRVFLLCMTLFALLCIAGFVLLDQTDAQEVAQPRPRPRLQAAVPPPTPPVTAPITPIKVQAPALPTEVSVREPAEPLPDLPPTVTTSSESTPGDEEEAPAGTLTEPPSEWLSATKNELMRLFIECESVEGEAVEGPVSIEVEFVYEPNILDGPAERAANPSVDDPYLAACLSDSLWDARIPELGAPGDFRHRMTFTLHQ